ncbi:hypothetical protein, partial [Gordonia westfalica]|uniref:hypothetical protein n=1 Tax=Gordonia westfalica TaxID=158898 RepID=UPI001AD7FBFD
MEQLKEVGGLFKMASGSNEVLNENAERAMAAEKAIRDLGMSNEEVARSLYGSDGQWKLLGDRLAATARAASWRRASSRRSVMSSCASARRLA